MDYFSVYPTPIFIMIGGMILSLLSYFFSLFIILVSKGWKFYAVRLFMAQVISQICCLIPQIVIPFITQFNEILELEDTQIETNYPIIKRTRNHQNILEACKIQGYLINSSWISGVLVSLMMGYAIYRTFQGEKAIKSKKREMIQITLIGLVAILLSSPLALWNEMENYGFTYLNKRYMYFCNIATSQMKTNTQQMVIFYSLVSLNILIFILSIILTIKLLLRKRQLTQQGLDLKDPILQLWIFPIVIVFVWNFNLIIKTLDAFNKYRPQNTIESIIWAILQNVICFEGVLYTSLFFYSYSPLLVPNLPNILKRIVLFFSCISIFNCCCYKNKVEDEICLYQDSEKDFNSSLMDSSAVQ